MRAARPFDTLSATNQPSAVRGYPYRTRDGRPAKVVRAYSGWWDVKVKGTKEIFTHFDTGNFIGSNSPHKLDIRLAKRE